MAAFFLDIDGTLVKHGTNELMPGRLEQLKAVIAAKHQIIFTTRRGPEFMHHPVYGRAPTERFLRSLALDHGIEAQVLYDIQSPRIVVNDEGAVAMVPETNEPWKFDLCLLAEIAQKEAVAP